MSTLKDMQEEHWRLVDAIDATSDALDQLATFLIAVRDGDTVADDDSINAMLALIFDVQDRFVNANLDEED